MSAQRLRAIVVGASGYTGAELVRLLAYHPNVQVVAFVSASAVDEDVSSRLPVWRGRRSMVFQALSVVHEIDCDVVFFAAPQTVAMGEATALLAAGKVVIDLSADFRLSDVAVFNQWYGEHTAVDILPQAVYGLSEVSRDALKEAMLIACPGCYATAVELALIPLVAEALINGQIIVDAKSGVSGAGRRSDRSELLLAEMATNFKAYAVDGHRHHPEIVQTLQRFSPVAPPNLIFIPHLLPTVRGIHANLYVPVDDAKMAATLLSRYWQGNPFIEVLSAGHIVELSQVIGSNRAILSAHPLSGEMILISVVLDNLLKGAAGQAVQNMNIRFGIEETTGLSGALADGSPS